MSNLQEIEIENKSKIIEALKKTAQQQQEEIEKLKLANTAQFAAQQLTQKIALKEQLKEAKKRINELEQYEFMYKELTK